MPTLRDLLLAQADREDIGVRWHGGSWTWREYVARARELAAEIRDRLEPGAPPHVGVLMNNTPEFALHLAAAAIGGHVVVGLNDTRRGAALAADIAKADCQWVESDQAHEYLLADLPGPATGSTASDVRRRTSLRATGTAGEVATDSLFMLIFTSGTSGDPKAVRVTHQKVVEPVLRLVERFGLDSDDTAYISMPMFHSNAVVAGWGMALAAGATIALGEKFSASRFICDIRSFGATYTNYVGKPLSYILAQPERDDDADNPLRIAFGNEAGQHATDAFGRRFGCRVVDGFGSTENAVVISRVAGTPAGALGKPVGNVKVLDPETSEECPAGVTGELVNVDGAGQFAGYYNDDAATNERLRDGMYWSGDLAYTDDAGWIYFAGRTAEWMRVDGENIAAAPIEEALTRHPAVVEAAVYGVPDPSGGDAVRAAVVLRREVDPEELAGFLRSQSDLGPKQQPARITIMEEFPKTATNKVLKRHLPQ